MEINKKRKREESRYYLAPGAQDGMISWDRQGHRVPIGLFGYQVREVEIEQAHFIA